MTDNERQEVNEFLAEWLRTIIEPPSQVAGYEKYPLPRIIPNHCTNAMPVLEKLHENEKVFCVSTMKTCYDEMYCTIELFTEYKNNPNKKRLKKFHASGDTIHEAICRCVVEYLKAQGVGR